MGVIERRKCIIPNNRYNLNMTQIVQKEATVLREKAKDVPISKIRSAQIKRIIKAMKDALKSQEDGVAVAAPQIGESLRIFVVSKRIFEMERNEQGQLIKRQSEQEEDETKDIIFINPVITKISRQKFFMEEGCLSVRYFYGLVKRSEKVSVKAYDENGKQFTRGASGLMAQVFQHETDHLNGILFTDKAKELKEMNPPNITHGKA